MSCLWRCPQFRDVLIEELHSLICSVLQHTFELDERDDPLLPSSGFHVKTTQELAGLGGDVFFGKAEIQSAYYHPLPAGWVSQWVPFPYSIIPCIHTPIPPCTHKRSPCTYYRPSCFVSPILHPIHSYSHTLITPYSYSLCRFWPYLCGEVCFVHTAATISWTGFISEVELPSGGLECGGPDLKKMVGGGGSRNIWTP